MGCSRLVQPCWCAYARSEVGLRSACAPVVARHHVCTQGKQTASTRACCCCHGAATAQAAGRHQLLTVKRWGPRKSTPPSTSAALTWPWYLRATAGRVKKWGDLLETAPGAFQATACRQQHAPTAYSSTTGNRAMRTPEQVALQQRHGGDYPRLRAGRVAVQLQLRISKRGASGWSAW